MAVEKDFELLDDYLSNRLSPQERESFENKLEADLELKQEYQFQQGLVEGVRSKRVAELKTMLNNIPASAIPGDQTALYTKLIGGVVITGLVITGMYFYFSEEKPEEVIPEDITEISGMPESSNEPAAVQPQETETADKSGVTNEPTISAPAKENTSKPADKSPGVSNETLNATRKREHELIKVVSSTFVTSSTEVVTESQSGNFNFHYAFKNKKLVLYGSFESNQYQILEFITADEHVFFLSYKSNYYLLDEKKDTPAPLQPISDPQLQKRLREFRMK